MENCVFCKITSGEVGSQKIWEDEKYFAFLDNRPIKPGHLLVLPKKHTDYIFDLEDEEYEELMLRSKDIAKKLKLKLNPKRVGVMVEGFGVPHVHVHLVPINEGFELNPLNGKPTAPEELVKIAKIILS